MKKRVREEDMKHWISDKEDASNALKEERPLSMSRETQEESQVEHGSVYYSISE